MIEENIIFKIKGINLFNESNLVPLNGVDANIFIIIAFLLKGCT